MPFVIATNTFYLQIQWSDDINAQPVNIKYLQNSYSYIVIQGTDNQEYQQYEILKLTQVLEIAQCTIDVSKIKGNMEVLKMNNCICTNNFTNECTASKLNIIETLIKSYQLHNLKIQSLTVQVSSQQQFDFYSCGKLNCSLNTLTLLNINADLKQFSGNWNIVMLQNCNFEGQIDNSKFKARRVQLIVTEYNHSNNFQALDNLECDSLCIQNQKQDFYQTIYLSLLGNALKQNIVEIYFEKVVSDLPIIQNINISYIVFTNCILISESKAHINLSNTNIEVQRNKMLDINNLFDNKIHDLNIFQICKPRILILRELNINLNELKGNWNSLSIQHCTFINTSVQDPESIKAEQICISNFNYELCSYFNAKILKLSKTQITQAYPKTKRLLIYDSTIDVAAPNTTIKHLTLFDRKLIKFSMLTLPSLQSIDLNYIQKSSPLYNTKTAIVNYIRQKKKNKNIQKQRLHRVDYEQKRKQKLQNRIISLVLYLNLSLGQPIQILSDAFYE
ncbi:Hypothetical_protein [Hexamita inflata]|uniref:Hypothetical_protein n=1 Tax=Hexamita inflata TaxID=28002 RepID=A0AA86TXZ2_9EUKA|nr:Hypothetical protein HINF_LOCUS12573 [Hexamita inflata]